MQDGNAQLFFKKKKKLCLLFFYHQNFNNIRILRFCNVLKGFKLKKVVQKKITGICKIIETGRYKQGLNSSIGSTSSNDGIYLFIGFYKNKHWEKECHSGRLKRQKFRRHMILHLRYKIYIVIMVILKGHLLLIYAYNNYTT